MVLRAVLLVLHLGALVLVTDVVPDQLSGQRWCLDTQVTAGSPFLTDALCLTPGTSAFDQLRDLRDRPRPGLGFALPTS